MGTPSARPDLVGPVREIYERYGYQTKILNVARHPIDSTESALEGADSVTMQFDLFRALAHDPWTDTRLASFMAQWAEIHGEQHLGHGDKEASVCLDGK